MKKILTQIRILLTGALILFLCSSCAILSPENPSQARYYDLQQPEKIRTAVPIKVVNFSSLSNERYRMSFRERTVSLRSSDLSRWAQTPGILLTKYLRLAFRNGENQSPVNKQNQVTVRGEILVFETTALHAELAVNYTLEYEKKQVSKTLLIREKMKTLSPEEFALAMSKASDRFARILARESAALARKK